MRTEPRLTSAWTCASVSLTALPRYNRLPVCSKITLRENEIREPMIIDTHCHVIATDTKKYPLKPLFGKQSDWSAEHPLDHPDMVAADQAAGIDKSVLVQASSAYAFDNSYVADSVAAHPKRFTGVFSIDVVAPDAVAKMKHWMSKGLTGMRIFTSGSTHAEQETFFADEAAYPSLQFASDQGLPG